MAWHIDLSPVEGFSGLPLRYVGWLSRDKSFPIGEIDESLFAKLCECGFAAAGGTDDQKELVHCF